MHRGTEVEAHRVQRGRLRRTTLPQSCADVTKSGNLNFLEPSGPLKVCNGTDLNFTILHYLMGDRGSTVVKVLCYKSEGRWFDPSYQLNFSLT